MGNTGGFETEIKNGVEVVAVPSSALPYLDADGNRLDTP